MIQRAGEMSPVHREGQRIPSIFEMPRNPEVKRGSPEEHTAAYQ